MEQSRNNSKLLKLGKSILAGVLLLGMVQSSAYAASTTDTVRVALFVDAGSTYKSTVPAVTFVSSSAWTAVPKGDGGSWVKLAAGEKARFSLDGFKVKVMETSDWTKAADAAKKLQSTTDKPLVFSMNQSGATMYQIYIGPYISASEAQKAAARSAKTLGLSGAAAPEVKGGLYLSAGTFANQQEADQLRERIGSQGTDAVVVLSGPGTYEVWVGDASTSEELDQLESQLITRVQGLALQPANQSGTSVILRSDVTLNLSNPLPVKHFSVNGSKAELWIQGSDSASGSIQLVERSSRKYRGGFELSRVNGQLAVVNELPLDKYLYSVVGGEVYSSWPQEALKAQAVAARSYALYQGTAKFKVAGLVDTTLSQAYNGIEKEAASIIKAVDSTSGEVLKSNGKLIEGLFSSNSGGMAADSTEVWKNVDATYQAVKSEGDKAAQAGLKMWYHVQLANGKTGYIREDNTKLTGTRNPAGLPYLTVTAMDTNVRALPVIQSGETAVAKMSPGDQAVVLEKVDQSNEYAWIKGPFTSDQLIQSLKGRTTTSVSSPIVSLEVAQRGPSGRAIQVKANGQALDVKYPDLYRSALGSLPSTLFDITATGSYTVLGAGNKTGTGTAQAGTKVLSASGTQSISGGDMVVLSGSGEARVVDDSNAFMFTGRGYGHGIGLSQWGAKGMADAGKDYRTILQHYYQNVTITKE
ncbi:SpoIID/LytB domain-containing protein [Paenibacillus sp. YPG26]|uniref:SpoIID/LytB domain-containing protein n=1 Tax=Paenibacillus sp. YPG26 TaxID=2878915 RepID=UPI00203B52FE|nr:SpoIID/LytB domain-containing protein [Paenibacillus sp. YPG26]USB34277.1 SpoIID/LytB domain-containing protein [Paenibacillus sp. YPG26]